MSKKGINDVCEYVSMFHLCIYKIEISIGIKYILKNE